MKVSLLISFVLSVPQDSGGAGEIADSGVNVNAQGRVTLSLNVDVSISFSLLGVMLFYCGDKNKRSCTRCVEVAFLSRGWHFDCKYLLLVNLLRSIYARLVC